MKRLNLFRLNPPLLMLSFWLWFFVQTFFIGTERDYFGWTAKTVKAGRMVDEMILGAMVVVLLIRRRAWLKNYLGTPLVLAIFTLAIFTLSTIGNNTGMGSALKFADLYLRYLVLFFFSVAFCRRQQVRFEGISRLLILLVLTQFAMNAAWFLHVNPIRNPMLEGAYEAFSVDWAAGTLTSQMEIAFMSVFVVFWGLYYVFVNRRGVLPADRRIGWLCLAISLMQLVWTDTKQVFGLFPLAFLLALLAIRGSRALRYVGGLVFAILAFMIVLHVREQQYGKSTFAQSMEKSWEVVQFAFRSIPLTPKGKAYHDVLFAVPHELVFPLLGAGPGQLNSRVALESPTPLAAKYTQRPLDEFQRIFPSESVGTWHYPNTGILVIYGELGLIGFLAYYGFHLLIFLHVLGNYQRGRYAGSTHEEALAFGLCCYIPFWVMESFIIDYLHTGLMVPLIWILAGMLYIPKSRRHVETELVASPSSAVPGLAGETACAR